MGYKNPVLAALAYMKAIDMDVDEPSFIRVAAGVKEATAEQLANGFVVISYDDVQRLCEIGDFIICAVEGIIFAFTPQEWMDGKAIDVK